MGGGLDEAAVHGDLPVPTKNPEFAALQAGKLMLRIVQN